MSRKYSGILRTLCNPSIFRILVYSESDVYAEPWYIQNRRIFRIRGIFRTRAYSEQWYIQNPNIFRTEAYSEPWHIQNSGIFRTLGYSEPEGNSEPCQTSMMEHCAKVVNSYIVVFANYNYFCNISVSCSLLFKI